MELFAGPDSIWEHLDLNLDNEWLADVELRRAVFTAIDVQSVVERAYGDTDGLADLIATQSDYGEAADLRNEAMWQVVDQAYVLPLVNGPDYTFVADGYTHIRPNPSSLSRGMYNIAEWGITAE